MVTNALKVILWLCFFGFTSCGEHGDKCPRQVYTQQEQFPEKGKLEKYKQYVDIVNSMGVFWIEGIRENSATNDQICIDCTQRFNNLLIDTRITFIFYIGEDIEDWYSGDFPWFTYYEKDGFYFKVSYYTPVDVQLPVSPKITPDEAIQTALRKEPLEEFCQYELCYRKQGYNETPKLCWILYGKRYRAYMDALTGQLLYWLDPVYH